jgi:hypothetical protein
MVHQFSARQRRVFRIAQQLHEFTEEELKKALACSNEEALSWMNWLKTTGDFDVEEIPVESRERTL